MPMASLSPSLVSVQNLGEQFAKKANFYFLIVAIISCEFSFLRGAVSSIIHVPRAPAQ